MSLSKIDEMDLEIFLYVNYEDLLKLQQINIKTNKIMQSEYFWKRKTEHDFPGSIKPEKWSYKNFYSRYYEAHDILKVKMDELKTFDPSQYEYIYINFSATDTENPFEEEDDFILVYDNFRESKDVWTTRDETSVTAKHRICYEPVQLCALNRFSKIFGFDQLKGIYLLAYKER